MRSYSKKIVTHLSFLSAASSVSKWIGYLSVFSLLAISSVVFENGDIGQVIIVIYGIFALICGIKNQEIFKLVIVSILIIMIATIVKSDILAKHFATYAFLLLVVSVICAVKERRRVSSDDKSTTAAPESTTETTSDPQKRYVSGAYSRNYQRVRSKDGMVFINRRKP